MKFINDIKKFVKSDSEHPIKIVVPEVPSEVEMSSPETQDLPWPRSIDSYGIFKIIGGGSTATVVSAKCALKSQVVAIKIIDLEKVESKLDDVLSEIKAMHNMKSKNIIECYVSFVHESFIWSVLKYFPYGSVLDFMNYLIYSNFAKQTDGVLPEWLIATISRDVLNGLEYIHKNDFIHRDIKSGNILLGSDGSAVIGDFGLSSTMKRNIGKVLEGRTTFVGTPCWMAPEVFEQACAEATSGYPDYNSTKKRTYNSKVDIWSVGIMFLEMATGCAPLSACTAYMIMNSVLRSQPPSLLSSYPDSFKTAKESYSDVYNDIVKKTLIKDPNDRPTATVLLKHKFFKKVKTPQCVKAYLDEFNLEENVQKWRLAEENSSSRNLPCVQYIQQLLPKPTGVELILRKRDEHDCLVDIRCTYNLQIDTSEEIAMELVKEGLLPLVDKDAFILNMDELLQVPVVYKCRRFRLPSSNLPQSQLSIQDLYGYANLLICSVNV